MKVKEDLTTWGSKPYAWYWDEYCWDVTHPFKSGPRKGPPACFTHTNRSRLSSWVQNQRGASFSFSIYVELIYNAVLVSGVQQSDYVMYMYAYSFSDSFPWHNTDCTFLCYTVEPCWSILYTVVCIQIFNFSKEYGNEGFSLWQQIQCVQN